MNLLLNFYFPVVFIRKDLGNKIRYKKYMYLNKVG